MSDELIINYIATSATYWHSYEPLQQYIPPTQQTTYWIKQSGSWVQGQLQPTYGGGYSIVPKEEGGGMPWEEVKYLLERLRFTFSKVNNEIVRVSYRGDDRYAIHMYQVKTTAQWADKDVRTVLDYAYQTILRYEKEQGFEAYGRSPLEPQTPLDAEEW